MDIEQQLEGLEIHLKVNTPTPDEWGTEVMRDDPEWGELTRDYFQLEDYVAEMVEQGNVEVESVEDMYAGSEDEKITLTVDL